MKEVGKEINYFFDSLFTSALRQNHRTCDLAQDWGRRGKERGIQILIDNRFCFVTLNSPPAVFFKVCFMDH